MKQLLPLIICLLFISSCTVENRLYNRGFHVEWNKKIKSNDNSIASKEIIQTELEVPVVQPVDELEQSKEQDVIQDVSDPEPESVFNENAFEIPVKDTVYIDDSTDKAEPYGVASALSLLGSVITFLVPFSMVSYLGLAFFAAAFVLSIISMIRHAYYKGYYKNNTLGVLTFILCLVLIFIVVAIILAFAL